MASFREELRTVLQVDGLSQYLAALRQAQQGNLQAALQVNQLRDNLRGITGALVKVGELAGIQAGQWAGVAAALYVARSAFQAIRRVIGEAMEEFQKYNTVLLRTTFLFNSMGSPVGMNNLRSFARERGATTGISEEETLSLLGRARQTGFGPQTLGRLVPLLQDVQTSGLTSANGALDIINKLLHQEGRGRGSMGAISEAATQLRLDPRMFTGGQQHDLQEIMRQLTARVGGLSEVMGQTISGTFQRHQTLLQESMTRLGGVIEASLVPLIEVLNRSLLGFVRTIDLATDPHSQAGNIIRQIDEAARSNPFNPASYLVHQLLGPLVRLQEQGGTADMARKQDEANKHLAAIEGNTQNMASAIMLSVFGSASAFTRGAASFRNLQQAISFRG